MNSINTSRSGTRSVSLNFRCLYLMLREPKGKGITYIKKHKRLSTKLNDLAKSAERLREQRLAKVKYRKRKREESKNTEIQLLPSSSSSAESSSQSSSSSRSTISSPPSWHRSAKSRSLRKVIRALPRSPEKN